MVRNKTWMGFATSEEKLSEQAVGMRIQPFYIKDEAFKISDTNCIVQVPAHPHAVRGGRLITGQQHFSGAPTAQLVNHALGT